MSFNSDVKARGFAVDEEGRAQSLTVRLDLEKVFLSIFEASYSGMTPHNDYTLMPPTYCDTSAKLLPSWKGTFLCVT